MARSIFLDIARLASLSDRLNQNLFARMVPWLGSGLGSREGHQVVNQIPCRKADQLCVWAGKLHSMLFHDLRRFSHRPQRAFPIPARFSQYCQRVQGIGSVQIISTAGLYKETLALQVIHLSEVCFALLAGLGGFTV